MRIVCGIFMLVGTEKKYGLEEWHFGPRQERVVNAGHGFSTFWLGKPKWTETDLKKSQNCPIWANVTQFGVYTDIPDWRREKVWWGRVVETQREFPSLVTIHTVIALCPDTVIALSPDTVIALCPYTQPTVMRWGMHPFEKIPPHSMSYLLQFTKL